MAFTGIAEEGNRRIDMKRKLNLAIILVLLASISEPIQANPHYTTWNGFVAETDQSVWPLIHEDFKNLQATGAFNTNITDFDINSSVPLAYGAEIGELEASLGPNDFVKFSFDQELTAFGFYYGGAVFYPLHETIEMQVFDSSGTEINYLISMVPPSSNANGTIDFYGIT